MDTIRDMIAAQRAELAEVLAGLPAPSWDEPTLCAGWRVREVVAHITMPFRFSGRRFALELARSRGRFNEMADRVARRDAAAMSPADLTGAVRSNTGHPWKPPGGGYTGALAHDLIHGLDITVPLGLDGPVHEERLRLVLPASLSDRSVKFFGTDLDGNYRPVLTSYDQLDDLAGLLAARGLPTARIHQILGGNALKFLGHML